MLTSTQANPKSFESRRNSTRCWTCPVFTQTPTQIVSGDVFLITLTMLTSTQVNPKSFESRRNSTRCWTCPVFTRYVASKLFRVYSLCGFQTFRKLYGGGTLRASLSGTFLQTLPEVVPPLTGHSLSPRSCPPTLVAPSERFGY